MIAVYCLDANHLLQKITFEELLEYAPECRLQKIENIRNESARNLSLAAGILLGYGLKQCGMDFRDIVIREGEHGKPYIVGEHAPCFNLSHSGTMAVCAMSDTEVGVDVELIKSKEIRESLIRKVCTEIEKEALQRIKKEESESAQREQFYKLWTVKESVMKQDGKGLSMDPSMIEAKDAFLCDSFLCCGKYIRIFRVGEYYISLCSEQEEEAKFCRVNIEDIMQKLP